MGEEGEHKDFIKGVEWRDVPGLEGYYMVSNDGQVYSHPRKGTSGGILKHNKGKRYESVMLQHPHRKPMRVDVHRLVAITFIPNPYELPEVNHKNLCRSDNTVGNLEWMTRQDNIDHYLEAKQYERCDLLRPRGRRFVKRGDEDPLYSYTELDFAEGVLLWA